MMFHDLPWEANCHQIKNFKMLISLVLDPRNFSNISLEIKIFKTRSRRPSNQCINSWYELSLWLAGQFPILQRGFRLVNQCWTNFVRINRNKIEYFLVFLNVIRSPSVVKLSPSRPCLSTSLERSTRSIPKFNFRWLPVACWLFGLSKNLTFITLLQFHTRLIIRNRKYKNLQLPSLCQIHLQNYYFRQKMK